MHRRAKSKPVSLRGGWELAVVGKADDSSAIPAAPDVHGGLCVVLFPPILVHHTAYQ